MKFQICAKFDATAISDQIKYYITNTGNYLKIQIFFAYRFTMACR